MKRIKELKGICIFFFLRNWVFTWSCRTANSIAAPTPEYLVWRNSKRYNEGHKKSRTKGHEFDERTLDKIATKEGPFNRYIVDLNGGIKSPHCGSYDYRRILHRNCVDKEVKTLSCGGTMLAMLRTVKASPGWKLNTTDGHTRESAQANTMNLGF